MLIFRGLTGNMLLGQFVGPFAQGLPEHQRRLHPRLQRLRLPEGRRLGEPQFFWLSMLIGVVGAALLISTSARRWHRDSAQAMETEPFALFVGKNADLRAS